MNNPHDIFEPCERWAFCEHVGAQYIKDPGRHNCAAQYGEFVCAEFKRRFQAAVGMPSKEKPQPVLGSQ